jgi:hypothetical protein
MINALHVLLRTGWACRTRLLALVLLVVLLAPAPASAQLGIDWAAIAAAIRGIEDTISNVVGSGLRAMNSALGTLNGLMSAIQSFFTNVIYPQDAINRARGLVAAIQGLYAQMRGIANINVASATLPSPQALEQILLSRNPLSVPNVSGAYQVVYQTVPLPQNAAPETRDLIDMTDAAAQAAMKRAIAIDVIADTQVQAAERINAERAQAAPGTAPMVEAQAAAWLVRSHAYTQSALADVIRIRSISLANQSAQLKTSAVHAAQIRQSAA